LVRPIPAASQDWPIDAVIRSRKGRSVIIVLRIDDE
jgi:hypothetical protein